MTEKLDHHHIVKIVGSYCTRPSELYILLWPVALCNLDQLVDDLDSLRLGHGDRNDIVARLAALELHDLGSLDPAAQRPQPACEGAASCPLAYLRQIIGCIVRAVAYCHVADVRHLDLKPSNILINPGRVYLADFGIAKDVYNREHTMTMGVQGTPKWRAPEISNSVYGDEEWSMQAADVYSLGLVMLNIATILYGASMDQFTAVVADLSPRTRAESIARYLTHLEGLALTTQEVEDTNAISFGPKHVVGLASSMLSAEARRRPTASQVDTELVELGGIDQIYHSPCCRKSSRFVTDRMNARLRHAVEEHSRLRAEHERNAKELRVLKEKDVTYESRIENEKKAHAKRIANLQEQLDRERKERQRLESIVAQTQRGPGKRLSVSRPGPNPAAPGPGCASNGPIHSTPHGRPAPTTTLTSPSPGPQRVSAQVVTLNARPSYSQAASNPIISAIHRTSSIPRVPSISPGQIPTPTGSPNPEAGFPLRSRNSGSRLPQPVNPATPIGRGPPVYNRDPASTDSTELSMVSSTFSLRSTRSRYSFAETSVAGTPALPSPVVNQSSTGHDGVADETVRSAPTRSDQTPIASDGVGLGVYIPTTSRRESVTSDRASVAGSNAAPSAVSSVYGGSVLSSPRAVRVPGLPTHPSWADVARKEGRI